MHDYSFTPQPNWLSPLLHLSALALACTIFLVLAIISKPLNERLMLVESPSPMPISTKQTEPWAPSDRFNAWKHRMANNRHHSQEESYRNEESQEAPKIQAYCSIQACHQADEKDLALIPRA